jgi:hypothetical protein
MVVATTVREIPKAWAICRMLKSVVMRYLMMSQVFFTPILLRAIHLSFRLRVLEGECSSSMVEGLERAKFPIVPGKWLFSIGRAAFYFRNAGFSRADMYNINNVLTVNEKNYGVPVGSCHVPLYSLLCGPQDPFFLS